MSTTTVRIKSDSSWEPFFYLQITGLPYRWYAMPGPLALPTDSSWGSDAWSAGAITHYRGLALPNDTMTQSLKDIVGGIAEPERIRLALVDFDTWDSTASKNFFGKLFAEGRAITDSTIKLAYLSADLTATNTTSLTAIGGDTFANSGDVYIGGETIGYTTTSVSASTTTFTTLTRNKYPCYVKPTDSAVKWPPTPYYRTLQSVGNVAISSYSPPVTSSPLLMVGRSA